MSKKFYISDLHLGHNNIIRLDNRPFKNMTEMETTIINNWNSVVSDNDQVYILGDMFWNNDKAPEILDELKGSKYLVKGNHDRINSPMAERFVWIKDYAEHLVLCHYPISHWKSADYGTIHLYGHIHTGRDSRPFEEYAELMRKREIPYRCYNVGCMLDSIDYTPRTLQEIISANNA